MRNHSKLSFYSTIKTDKGYSEILIVEAIYETLASKKKRVSLDGLKLSNVATF